MIRKSLLLFVALCSFMAMSSSVNAQSNSNDQNLIGKARGAAHDCLSSYHSQGIQLDASVQATGICFVSGQLHKVIFYTTVKCHTEPCPKIMSAIVATVYFDCDNNITSVECSQ